MNGKTITTGILAGALALVAVMQYRPAASQTTAPATRIGLVSIRDVFNGSKKHALYQAQLAKRAGQTNAQLDDLAKQVQEEERELKTVRPGTADHLKQSQVVLEARSKLRNQEELIKLQRMTEDKKWFEDLYQEALRATEVVAKERGLDLVLERSEPRFPIPNEEMWSTLGTHKVLYGGGAVDLTNDVIARVDASASLQP
ncbi:MAG: OmpH family outer membrane protein [Planctomycetes bacterium]|nr:OmpH family outer membrane protein [Planctomycetota bacterium]